MGFLLGLMRVKWVITPVGKKKNRIYGQRSRETSPSLSLILGAFPPRSSTMFSGDEALVVLLHAGNSSLLLFPAASHTHSLSSSLSLSKTHDVSLLTSTRPCPISSSSPSFKCTCHPAQLRMRPNGRLELASHGDTGVSSRWSACKDSHGSGENGVLWRVLAVKLGSSVFNSLFLS